MSKDTNVSVKDVIIFGLVITCQYPVLNAKHVLGMLRRKMEFDKRLVCKCGCGKELNKQDGSRFFISGHNSKIKLGGFQEGNKTKSQFKKGHVGFKYWEGKERSNETKIKISEVQRGDRRSPETEFKVGNHPSTEFKIGRTIPKEQLERLNKIWKSKEWKEMAQERRKYQILPTKDTSIEIKIQNFLKDLNILFETHKYIQIRHAYQCDLFVPAQDGITKSIIIECDGCYFHGCQICNKNLLKWQRKQICKDNKRSKEIKGKGWKIIRLKEHDIVPMTLEEFKSKLNEH